MYKTPELNLWTAVLIRAYKDLLRDDQTHNARQWFFESQSGLSQICGILGIPPSVARKRARYILRHANTVRVKNMFTKFEQETQ